MGVMSLGEGVLHTGHRCGFWNFFCLLTDKVLVNFSYRL